MAWLVITLLLALICFGMPIGFALMIAAAIAMALSGIDLIMVPIQLFAMSSAATLEMSQMWARETSMTTFSSTSRKSKAFMKSSAEAKNSWPSTM